MLRRIILSSLLWLPSALWATSVIKRVPINAKGEEQAAQAEMRLYRGATIKPEDRNLLPQAWEKAIPIARRVARHRKSTDASKFFWHGSYGNGYLSGRSYVGESSVGGYPYYRYRPYGSYNSSYSYDYGLYPIYRYYYYPSYGFN